MKAIDQHVAAKREPCLPLIPKAAPSPTQSPYPSAQTPRLFLKNVARILVCQPARFRCEVEPPSLVKSIGKRRPTVVLLSQLTNIEWFDEVSFVAVVFIRKPGPPCCPLAWQVRLLTYRTQDREELWSQQIRFTSCLPNPRIFRF